MTQPEYLINDDGQPQFGYHPNGVQTINYLDYDLRSPMDKPRSLRQKRRQFNQFQFVGITCDQLIIGVAIADLKLISAAFCYFYDPISGDYEECSFTQPLARKTQFSDQPNNAITSFRSGRNKLQFSADSRTGIRRVLVETRQGLSVTATIDELTNYNPLAVCSRSGYSGWTYTQKAGARICHGSASWQGKQYNLEQLGALAAIDYTGGFMRRETAWNWGNLSHRLADGRRIAMNLAAGVNETGVTENGIWLDDQLHHVDGVDFQFDRYNPSKSWMMRSTDGRINLHFEPRGQRKEKVNALLIASNFTQHFGQYYGDITIDDEVIHLEGVWGFAEDHYAKW